MIPTKLTRFGGLILALASCCLPVSAHVLDDFNGPAKTGWTDATFIAGFGLPTQADGHFVFQQPPAGQAIFSASQKTTEAFELKEGRTIEFRADIVTAGAKDSFAVLAFIPNTGGNNPLTLAGYGFAKSTTDILITKGINRYFAADSYPADLPNENITMTLTMTVSGGSVTIRAQVLDKAQANKVIWEKSVIDTPAADVLAAGTDSPAGPFLTTGFFTLYLYQDFDKNAPENPYQIIYDNAETFVTDSVVLDDFNDNTKTDWTDATFIGGFGLPTEAGGQFTFQQPPAGQAIFSASQKTSRAFELKEGERLQFNVDVVSAGGKDSFAILAFIPNTGGNNPLTLVGYGFAKSTTDILLTKGINRYFVAENPPDPILNENITMSLTMTVRGGTAEINARVLDKAQGNKVIWEKTVFDTPAADVLGAGTDSPAGPFLTTGFFTLYLYQDFDKNAPENPYQVVFDNAVVSAAPVSANVAPLISDISPRNTANFLPASTAVTFKLTDEKALSDDGLAVVLNGTKYTTANGLVVSGSGTTRTASLAVLQPNINYAAQLIGTDSDGASTTNAISFDTFLTTDVAVEVEDYNFGGGQFIDNPVPVTEGASGAGSYGDVAGVQDTDFNDTRTTPNGSDTAFRTQDPVRMQRTLDLRRAAYDAAGGPDNVNGVYDYDVGDLATDEWMNYTRTFGAGSYEVYLREAVANLDRGESVLELVTGDRTQPAQTTRVLGSFFGTKTGFEYRNFPLTDGTGQNKVILRLSGETTVRLRHVTADTDDGARYLNYLIFVPVADPGIQRATVNSISPAPDSVVVTTEPAILVGIQNRDTTVKSASIKLLVNGAPVTPVVTATADGATVGYKFPVLPVSGVVNTAQVTFSDNLNVEQTSSWSFTVSYLSLDPATRFNGVGVDAGFKVRVVQATSDNGLLDNTLQRAEDQLAPGSIIPKAYDITETDTVVNFSQNGLDGGGDGFFQPDAAIPGESADLGTDNYAMEVLTYLDIPAGIVRFGMNCDDGYKVQSAATLTPSTLPLAFHNGGPANETFDVVVAQAGLYPFRLVWYERGGGAFVEWFTVDRTTGERTLLNEGVIKAYATVRAVVPAVELHSTAVLGTAFTPETGAVVDSTAHTVTVDRQGEVRFYRLSGATVLTIDSIVVGSSQVVLKYH